jgi:hypothetical protein
LTTGTPPSIAQFHPPMVAVKAMTTLRERERSMCSPRNTDRPREIPIAALDKAQTDKPPEHRLAIEIYEPCGL